jgi:hypothetical protein
MNLSLWAVSRHKDPNAIYRKWDQLGTFLAPSYREAVYKATQYKVELTESGLLFQGSDGYFYRSKQP